MAKKHLAAPELNDLIELSREFAKRDTRASAIMMAALVDDALRALLEAYLSRDVKIAADLFRTDAALGSFGPRIKLSYLLGLIGPKVHHDLEVIRSIRNDFAHMRTKVTFATASVKDRCATFQTPQMIAAVGIRQGSAKSAFFQFFTAFQLTSAVLMIRRVSPPAIHDSDEFDRTILGTLITEIDTMVQLSIAQVDTTAN